MRSYLPITALVSCLIIGDVFAEKTNAPELIVAVGAGGAPEYEEQFNAWADRWQSLANQVDANLTLIGVDAVGDDTDLVQLKTAIESSAASDDTPLVIVLIGHGTHLQDVAKFNLRGPDVSADDMTNWLADVKRPVALIQCASSSAAFLKKLSGPNRVVVTATRSSAEQNFARFGDYFSAALTNRQADLDHDDAVSLLEAFLFASDRVTRFYQQESRLATEHSLLDDNGDGLGTPGKFFRGIHAVKAAKDKAPLDGRRSHQIILFQLPDHVALAAEKLAERDAIEAEIDQLRQRKSSLGEDAFYEEFEPLMIRLARLYQKGDDEEAPKPEAR